MMQQRELLFERLKVAKFMRSFTSHHQDGSEDLRSRLEQLETNLTAIQKAVAEGTETLKKAEGERERHFRLRRKN